MIIYFNASLLGKDTINSDYKTIIKHIESLDHEVIYDHVLKRSHNTVNLQSPAQHRRDYKKITNDIRRSDAMIIEATYPSIGLGHTMAIALQNHKNVLVLYQNPSTPHGLLIGHPDRLLSVHVYEKGNVNDLKKQLSAFLVRTEKRLLKIRFNLMIDTEQERYLENVSKTQKITKSEYIRRLLNKDIKKFLRENDV